MEIDLAIIDLTSKQIEILLAFIRSLLETE